MGGGFLAWRQGQCKLGFDFSHAFSPPSSTATRSGDDRDEGRPGLFLVSQAICKVGFSGSGNFCLLCGSLHSFVK